ncbi:MAG: hypothetical protein RL235_250 [Chlamydiota bacterium]|jgi:hypothetical protein
MKWSRVDLPGTARRPFVYQSFEKFDRVLAEYNCLSVVSVTIGLLPFVSNGWGALASKVVNLATGLLLCGLTNKIVQGWTQEDAERLGPGSVLHCYRIGLPLDYPLFQWVSRGSAPATV